MSLTAHVGSGARSANITGDMRRLCKIPGCTNGYHARGWCMVHYQRWRSHGDPQTDIPIGGGSTGPSYVFTADGKRCKFARIMADIGADDPQSRATISESLRDTSGNRKSCNWVSEILRKADPKRYRLSVYSVRIHLVGGCSCDPEADELHGFGLPDRSGKF